MPVHGEPAQRNSTIVVLKMGRDLTNQREPANGARETSFSGTCSHESLARTVSRLTFLATNGVDRTAVTTAKWGQMPHPKKERTDQ